MTQYNIPSDAKIKKGVLANKAALACIKRPIAGCESLCTEQAILEGKPVVMAYRYGYVSTSAFDAENESTHPYGMGDLIEIRPLKPDDEFHPNRILVVYRATLPRTNRLSGSPSGRRAKNTVTVADEDSEDLARELGIL